MKFALAFATAAAAVKIARVEQKLVKTRPVSKVLQMTEEVMPDWLSDDPECAALQGLAWAGYQLTDMDNNGEVTLGEMEDSIEFIMSITPADVEEVYYMIAGIDEDYSYISETDLEVACPYLMEEGFAIEDCYAIGILLAIADATIGDADGKYELNEVQDGIGLAQEFIGTCEMGLEEAMAMVDLDADGTFEYSEFEQIMPYMCEYV